MTADSYRNQHRITRLIAFCLGAMIFAVNLAGADPPNVVLIISDDQFADDFGFMGNRHVQTPHLDRLAAKSARFVNGSVPTSVCSPSLATLLTGLYPHQHGIHYNHPPPGNSAFNRMTSVEEYQRVRSQSFNLIQLQPTLPRVLADERNYVSLQTGKFWEGHYQNAGFTEGMTIFEPVPGQAFGGNRKLANGKLAAHGNGDWGLKIGRETMQPIEEFLDKNEDLPFLVWYAPYLPHQPHDAPEKFFDLYRENENIPAHRIPYYASISQFDETVGQLVQMIKERQLQRETLFIFVIDNGWEASQTPERRRPLEFAHTKESKRSPFEPGLRTPILLCWEGTIPPGEFEAPVSSIDLVPTIYSACGLKSDSNLPGIDLYAVARGKESLDPHRPLFGEIYPGDATSLGHPEKDIAYRWIKQDDWKLIVPHLRGGKAWGNYLDQKALYNLTEDPHEKNNLYTSQEFQVRAQQLETRLNQWWNGKASDLSFGKLNAPSH